MIMKLQNILCCLLLSGLTLPVLAQSKEGAATDKPKIEQFDNWSKVCFATAKDAPKGTKAKCYLEQTFSSTRANKKETILVWRFSLNDRKEAIATVLTPNNVLLARGVTFGMASDKSTVVPFYTCRPGFCELRFQVEPDLIRSLGAREGVSVSYGLTNNNTVAFAVPMKGFAKGFEALKK